MKRVLTIQDISCVGKCSLTVALPILSCMGVEACPLPTALLSTHTAFEHYTFCDLTSEIPSIENTWEKEHIYFDTIASGYLGSILQIELVEDLFRRFLVNPRTGKQALKIVDPAMADEGKLYKGFTMEFVESMKKLCAKADVIVPNLTEGCLLADMPYRTDADAGYWKEVLLKLSQLGCRQVVLTGFAKEGKIGAISYDARTKEFYSYLNEKLPVSYHGTGDIFASVLAGAMTLGWSLADAQKLAVDFTLESMKAVEEDPDGVSYGVNFEEAIPHLVQRLHLKETGSDDKTS